jgi:ribosomal protein S18 acetylase RimI-like enzyme
LTIRLLENNAADIELGCALVQEYVVATAQELGRDVDVILSIVPDLQDFAGRYLTSDGAFLVADDHAGVGVTPLGDSVCEMNRLWVRPGYRRRGLGRALSLASIDAARELGFTRMLCDVAPSRMHAIAMYRALGFADAPPAHEYPFEMVFLAREL